MSKNILAVVAHEISTMLNNSKSFNHFLGGSRYFGFDTENSDYDFFVETGHDALENIYNQGFEIISNESDYNPICLEHARLHIGKNHIDLVILSKDQFNECRENHKIIDKILNKNPEMVHFIKMLKIQNPAIKGATIYKALLV